MQAITVCSVMVVMRLPIFLSLQFRVLLTINTSACIIDYPAHVDAFTVTCLLYILRNNR